jgi:ABC-type Zn2+ transport system substrate-binding protein/surface adhesin
LDAGPGNLQYQEIRRRTVALNSEQEALYKKTMQEVRKQLSSLDAQIEKELALVREKLAALQEQKKTYRLILEGTARLLGLEMELEEEEEKITDMPKV